MITKYRIYHYTDDRIDKLNVVKETECFVTIEHVWRDGSKELLKERKDYCYSSFDEAKHALVKRLEARIKRLTEDIKFSKKKLLKVKELKEL